MIRYHPVRIPHAVIVIAGNINRRGNKVPEKVCFVIIMHAL